MSLSFSRKAKPFTVCRYDDNNKPIPTPTLKNYLKTEKGAAPNVSLDFANASEKYFCITGDDLLCNFAFIQTVIGVH